MCARPRVRRGHGQEAALRLVRRGDGAPGCQAGRHPGHRADQAQRSRRPRGDQGLRCLRSEEHTSELQSLMRISYAVFCLKKKKITETMTVNFRHLLN